MATKKSSAPVISQKEMSVEDKLRALYALQQIDSSIDKIRTIRGELPLEVQDLEDEIAGLETRIGRLKDEISGYELEIANKKVLIKDASALIAKYEQQQQNVRNNREFESLSKEIEFQNLEIQLAEKRIKEFKAKIELINKGVEEHQQKLESKKADLAHKKSELDDIIAETQKEESTLIKKSAEFEDNIEERYLLAYKKIRKNSFNRLAVVSVERNACGGCFNMIPPQRQLDIAQRKKIIACEHCGRILTDSALAEEEAEKVKKIIGKSKL